MRLIFTSLPALEPFQKEPIALSHLLPLRDWLCFEIHSSGASAFWDQHRDRNRNSNRKRSKYLDEHKRSLEKNQPEKKSNPPASLLAES
jgi:hypothetical protein